MISLRKIFVGEKQSSGGALFSGNGGHEPCGLPLSSRYSSSVALLRGRFLKENAIDSTTANRHHIARTILGIPTCDVFPDLNTEKDLEQYLRGIAFSQIGYLQSKDFPRGKLPSEDYLYVNGSSNGEHILVENLNDNSRRFYLLSKVFESDFNDYLETFGEMLSRQSAISGFKNLFLRELSIRNDGNYEAALAYLKAEFLNGQAVRNEEDNDLNGTKAWAVNFVETNPLLAQRVYRLMRDGQRYFCKVLLDTGGNKTLPNGNGHDEAIELVTSWIKESPNAFAKAIEALEILFEKDIPLGPSRLSNQLDLLRRRVRDLTVDSLKARKSLLGLLARSSSAVLRAEDQVDTQIYSANMPIEQVLKFLQEQVTKSCVKVFNEEKQIIDKLKAESRWKSIRTGSKWFAGVGTAAAVLIASAGYVVHARSQRFNEAVRSIQGEINPFLKIDYKTIYSQAQTELGSDYPPEAKDSKGDYMVQYNIYFDFLKRLNDKYFRVLAVYLTPELSLQTSVHIQNGSISGVPEDLKASQIDDLRDLFTKDEWYYPMNGTQPEPGKTYYDQFIGVSLLDPRISKGFGSCANFLTPSLAYRRDSYNDPNTKKPVYTGQIIDSPPEIEIFRGVQPGNYIDTDQNYLNLVSGLTEMLKRIEEGKESLIKGFEQSPEVLELNLMSQGLSSSEDLIKSEFRSKSLIKSIEEKQKGLEPVLLGIARCECRLRDLLEVRIPDRVR